MHIVRFPEMATRDRIVDAARALFAERGYDRTSIADIERAAGLVPRAGTLYQHFGGGKAEVFRAALERQVAEVEALGTVMEMLPLGDLRGELTLLARWNLASLDRREELLRFIRQDGDRFPELMDELYERLAERPYDLIVAWLRERGERAGVEEHPDYAALALIMVESMTAYRAMRSTFGRVPGDVDDERYVTTWVELGLAFAARHGLE
jgi:AcrR family transcriptional regulator